MIRISRISSHYTVLSVLLGCQKKYMNIFEESFQSILGSPQWKIGNEHGGILAVSNHAMVRIHEKLSVTA